MHHKEISVIYLQFTLYQKKVHSFFFFFLCAITEPYLQDTVQRGFPQ